MDEFELDAGLHDRLKTIREGVRRLFEQLRLRGEDGDVTGKARLERVPALAKRNFGQLTDRNSHLAIKQAWRLIDFLEGSDAARLSPRAREALRVVELDRQLAAFRASHQWKSAATRLREAVATLPHVGAAAVANAVGATELDSVPPGNGAAREAAVEQLPPFMEEESLPRPISRLRQQRRKLLLAAMIVIACAVPAVIWRSQGDPHPSVDCIAIESAPERVLAEHWTLRPATLVPRPALRAGARSYEIRISDPANGGPVRSTWTTSRYSYAEGGIWSGPGGGKSDYHLRVGGWGDTYLSLLQIPVPTDHAVQRAVIRLTVLEDSPGSRPTSMTLRAIGESWHVDSGTDHRMWWKDCPKSDAIRTHLPPPGPPDSVYEIDITDLYNQWARGLRDPDGIILEPEHIGQWNPAFPRYSNFSSFYSTRARDPAIRPRLVLTY